MGLKFCKKCNGLMIPKNKEGVQILVCNSCKEEHASLENLCPVEKMPRKKKVGEGSIEHKNPLATYTNICQKCGYNQAQIIDLGVFYSDEDNLILLKCGKCGWSQRIGRKVN